MRQLPLFAAALCLPFLSGCFPLVFPTVDYTPSVDLEARRDEVHAFRVDFTKITHDLAIGPGSQQLTEIPASNTDEIPAQIKPGITYGLVVIGIAVNFFDNTSHDMALRLYRPGYELVEIQSWDHKNRVAWKPASELAAQEHALDALLPSKWLSNGSISRSHQNALLYGASEYERLAKEAAAQEDRNRLSGKASELRKIATDASRVIELP